MAKRSNTLRFRFPTYVPSLELMLSDLGNPSAGDIAQALGVDRSTVSGWIRRGTAPYPAMLALFFVTRWGHSHVHCEAHNSAVMQASIAASVRSQLMDALAKLERLGQISDFGSANDPAPEVVAVAPATPVIPVPCTPQQRQAAHSARRPNRRNSKVARRSA